jgi:hypothetical protein
MTTATAPLGSASLARWVRSSAAQADIAARSVSSLRGLRLAAQHGEAREVFGLLG